MRKLVSVIIPTFKGSDTLPVALESVRKQSFCNYEVIVSDDNGPGEKEQVLTSRIVERYRESMTIKYLVNEHVNGSHARNEGLKSAEGDYICFLDDDDYYMPDYLNSAVSVFNGNPSKDIVFFDVSVLSKDGTSRRVSNDSINSKEILFSKKEIGTGSNLFFRRKIYDETGGFDERYSRFQDFEFITKRLNKYDSIWINDNLIVKFYNKTDNSLNYRKNLEMQDLYRQDSVKNGIIDEYEAELIRNIQLHNLFKDMLAKNMDSVDIRVVYNILGENNMLTAYDNLMFRVYSMSTVLFNLVFRIYMLVVYGGKKVGEKYLVDYRNDLISSSASNGE